MAFDVSSKSSAVKWLSASAKLAAREGRAFQQLCGENL
jgi:hypothetical protein